MTDHVCRVFEGEEKPLLIALPPVAYEVMDWVYGRRVQANSHVAYARNWYSRPVRVRRLHRGPEDRGEHARDLAQKHQALHAPAPAGVGLQQVFDERGRPSRQNHVEAVG